MDNIGREKIEEIISDFDYMMLIPYTMPVFEWEVLKEGSEVDYMLTEIERKGDYIYYDSLKLGAVYFDGLTDIVYEGDEVVRARVYIGYFDSLHDILEHISADITQHIHDNGYNIVD